MSRSRTQLSAIRLMIQASFAFSLMALCVKFASHSLPSLEIVFFRSLIGSFMIFGLILRKRVSPFGKEHKLLVLRGISGFAALSLHFYTISRLPLGTAVMLNYTGPVFALIFAIFFLGERPGIFLISMILVSFAGIYLLVEGAASSGPPAILPHFLHWSWTHFLALLSAIFAAVAYVSIRAVRRRESPLTVIFYFTAISTVGSLFYLPFGFRWPDLEGWLAIAGVGVGSFYGQIWMTIALRRAPAALLSPFSYLSPLLTFFYGWVFWNERLTAVSFSGAFLIIAGGFLVSYFETRHQRPSFTPEAS